MHSLVISKATNKIILAVRDGSTGIMLQTPQQHLEAHCAANDLDVNDYFAIEYTKDAKKIVNLAKDIYNPTTGLVELDPNYVPPEPTPTAPTEPTV